MPMKLFNRILVILFAFVSVIQIYGVSETVYRIIKDWRKFYGNDYIGGITLGTTMVSFTYLASLFIIVLSFLVIRKTNDKFTLALSKSSIGLLSTGIIVLSLLLVSPFAELYPR